MGQGPVPSEFDYSTYDMYYSDGVVEQCIQKIIALVRERGSVSFAELYKIWVESDKIRKIYIHMAVEKLITEKRALLDRFGFRCYLHSDGVIVYTQRDFPTSEQFSRQELSIYGEQLVGVLSSPFSEIVSQRQSTDQARMVEELRNIPDPDEAETPDLRETYLNLFTAKAKMLSLVTKVRLLEESLIYIIKSSILGNSATVAEKRARNFSIAFVKLQRAFLFETPEPWATITATKLQMAKPNHGRGRRRKEGSRPKIVSSPVPQVGTRNPDNTIVENVYLHTLNSNEVEITSYAVTSKFNNVDANIRIYKPSEGTGWREVLSYEFPAYNDIIQKQRQIQKQQYEKYPIYGTLLGDGKMRIIDKTVSRRSSSSNDARTQPRGEICTTRSVPKLFQILKSLGIEPPKSTNSPEALAHFAPRDEKSTKDLMISYLLQKKYTQDPQALYYDSEEDLLFYCQWYISNYPREKICEIVEDFFARNDMLMVT